MHMTPLEKEICLKIKMGDEKAFEYLFKSYYSLLCIYACDLLKNEDLSKEIVQETLIRIWENRQSFEINTSLKSYLYRSIHNTCINQIKHTQVLKNQADKYSEEIRYYPELFVDEEYSLDQYLYEGVEEDILEAINSLPEQCRVIFRMNRFEMLRYDEIAKNLNVSTNTIKTQIRRALEKIRASVKNKIASNTKKI